MMASSNLSSTLRIELPRGLNDIDSVLLAEDDPIFRKVMSNWLERWNYRVIAVDNGLDAWNALQQENSPQIAILDWMMPGVDGPELCRRVRSERSARYTYIVLVTAKDNKKDVVEGLDAGADDYLTKPFHVDELRARIRTGERILRLEHALRQARDYLQFEAAHDSLTGLWNHRAILELLEKENQRNRRNGDPIGVMMADLDHFKKINDTYGHLVGDTVLHECADRMVVAFRGYDSIGRYGGEEFLFVMPGCNSADLMASAERLRTSIARQPINTTAGSIAVTISVGVVSSQLFQNSMPGYQVLLSAADDALYQAKAQGRNRVVEAISTMAKVEEHAGT